MFPFHDYCKRNLRVPFLNGVKFLQLVLDDSPEKAKIRYEMSVPTAFEGPLCFYKLTEMDADVCNSKLIII